MAQTMYSGVTHERCADFRHGKKRKKQKRGEFITPPRPTGRRSNNHNLNTLRSQTMRPEDLGVCNWMARHADSGLATNVERQREFQKIETTAHR